MRADKCYCRPNREPLPQWPCEDATTALKLCCLSATVYDVRCLESDLSPGDVIGIDQNGEQLINCPDTGANTNLQGKAFFWFPDANATDQINPWRPCPQVCTESQLPGGIITNCLTGVQVTWNYSCDTGLVTFKSTWIFAPGGIPPSFLTYPSVGIVTAAPDWYLDNEIDIPYLTSGVNYNRPRFSVKVRMTCEARPPDACELPDDPWYDCFVDADICQYKQLNYHIEYDDGVSDEIFGTFDWADGLYNNPGQSPSMNITVDGLDGPYLYVSDIGHGNTISAFLMTADLSCIDGEVYFIHEFEIFDGGTAIHVIVTIWSGI